LRSPISPSQAAGWAPLYKFHEQGVTSELWITQQYSHLTSVKAP